jgi:hypothetical protein
VQPPAALVARVMTQLGIRDAVDVAVAAAPFRIEIKLSPLDHRVTLGLGRCS